MFETNFVNESRVRIKKHPNITDKIYSLFVYTTKNNTINRGGGEGNLYKILK